MVKTRVGYSGGKKESPTYHSLGDHTECFQLEYDPAQIGFAKLLEVFWAAHDPTQGPGSPQYKAILFFHDEEQKRLALESKAALEKTLGEPVLTEILPASAFWRAEDYHQKYVLRNHALVAKELRAKHTSEQAFVDDPLSAKVNAWLAGTGDLAALERDIDTFGLSKDAQTLLLETARRAAGSDGSCPR